MVSHSLPFHVAWRHADAAGLIHYANIFRYFEDAEHQLLAKSGYDHANVDSQEVTFPRVHVACDYLRPLAVGDSGTVTCTVAKVGRKSITFDFTVVKHNNAGETLCAQGQIVTVALAWATRTGVPVPDALRTALEG